MSPSRQNGANSEKIVYSSLFCNSLQYTVLKRHAITRLQPSNKLGKIFDIYI